MPADRIPTQRGQDRIAGLAVVLLASFALLAGTGAGGMEPGALLAMAVGITGLILVLRTRPR